MKRHWALCVWLLTLGLPAGAQQLLSLDSCRAMALRTNKQMDVSHLKKDVAKNIRKSMRTKYLPHISAIGTYQFTSREISLLNDEQKAALPNIGTTIGSMAKGGMADMAGSLTKMGSVLSLLNIPPQMLEPMQQEMATMQQNLAQGVNNATGMLNAGGQRIVDALHTDTRNLWAGSIMAVQPVFMGGSIIAMNKMADLGEQMASHSEEARRQSIIYSVDKIYWQVVSLKHKKRLAESFLAVVQKLDNDVQKMIAEGVATKSDGLSVNVKLNEAEMTVQKVNDGLVLSKMLLCQTIGLPMNEDVTLADEDADQLSVAPYLPQVDREVAMENRPELKMLDNTVALTKQTTNLLKAGNLPMVAVMGGYSISNPSLYNGFEKKFKGIWNVGVLVRVPIWNWGDVMYKVRASKGATAIAALERQEAREKIELQVNQTSFKVEEANKRLAMAEKSVEKADENLRMATVGFSEGVITPATVMEAQTAWLQAKSQHIDAQIDVLLSAVDLQKSLGILAP